MNSVRFENGTCHQCKLKWTPQLGCRMAIVMTPAGLEVLVVLPVRREVDKDLRGRALRHLSNPCRAVQRSGYGAHNHNPFATETLINARLRGVVTVEGCFMVLVVFISYLSHRSSTLLAPVHHSTLSNSVHILFCGYCKIILWCTWASNMFKSYM